MDQLLGMPAAQALELIERVTSFAESALTVAGRPISGNARVRVSDARRLVVLEVTHRDHSAFDVVTQDHAAIQALDQLRDWTTNSGSTLVLERGSRDRLRIKIVFTQTTAPARLAPGTRST